MQKTTSILLTILLLAACGANRADAPGDTRANLDREQISISFAVPDWELALGWWDGLVEEFEAQNPDIHVTLKPFSEILGLPVGEFRMTDDFMLKLASSSDAFRVLFLTGMDGETVRNRLVRDLKPFMDANPIFRSDDFMPGALEAAAWDGGVWAMPTALDYEIILFDRDAFDKANLPYPKSGWTWDDFEATARTLTRREGDQVTRWGFVRDDFMLTPARLVELRTGPLLDDATIPPTPRFTEAAVKERVQWWADLILQQGALPFGPLPEPTEGESTWIEQGIAAMSSAAFSGSAWVRSKQPQSIGIAPYPVDTPDAKTTALYIEQVAMSAGTAYPQAVWRWLDFLSRQPPGQSGKIPARRSVAEMTSFWSNLDKETEETLRFAANHAVPSSRLMTDWPAAYEVLNAELRAVFNGDESVTEALTTAQTQVLSDLAAEAGRRSAATPVVVTVATAEPPPAAGATTITFVPLGSDLGSDPFRDAASQFHKSYPDVVVEIKNPDFAGSSVAVLAGQADCFQTIPSLDDPEALSAILNLDPFLEADLSLSLGDFFPALVDQYRRAGQIWGLPAAAQPYVVEYNRELFDEAGLDAPAVDWTLNEFLALAQALTQESAEGKQYGFVGLYETFDLMLFVERLGGRILDDTQDPPAAAFADPATVEAVQWYVDLSMRHRVKPVLAGEEEREALIGAGRAAMWAGSFDRYEELSTGVLPFPAGSDAAPAPILNTSGFFISAKATAPRACWEWIKFLTTQPSIVQGLPARRSAAASEAYRRQAGAEQADVYVASIENNQTPSVFLRLIGQNWLGPYVFWLEDAYRQIVENGLPAEAALTQAQEKADAYRACVVAKQVLNDPQGYRTCAEQAGPSW